jgi:hypothetical protein
MQKPLLLLLLPLPLLLLSLTDCSQTSSCAALL